MAVRYICTPLNRLVLVILLSSSWLLSACAWEDTLHQVSQTPRYVGLQEHIRVVHQPRWTLPLGTPVALRAHPNVPASWHSAAERGLARVFDTQAAAQIELAVDWPAASAASALTRDEEVNESNGWLHSTAAWLTPRGMAQSEQLWVAVRSLDGQYQEKLALRIQPQVWGDHWHADHVIEASFAQLAETLAGR
ncbi:MAG: hypothetical protein AAF993_21260 [Pseudomonadota bacterium]